MALKQTQKELAELLEEVSHDLHKACEKGNKAAAQRVRTGTVQLEKVAKRYRKESVKAGAKKKPAAKKKGAAKKAPVRRAAAKKTRAKAPKTSVKATRRKTTRRR